MKDYLQIDLKELRVIPAIICCMAVVQSSVSFNMYPALMPLSYLALGLCLLSCLVMASMLFKEPVFAKYDLAVFIFCGFLMVLTILNGGDTKNAFFTSAIVSLPIMLFRYYSHNTSLLVQAIAFAFSACIYAALIQVVMFPEMLFEADNMFDGLLLGGNRNQTGCRILCGIVCSAICIKFHRGWLVNTIVLTLVSIVLLGMLASMTSLSCIIVFILLALIPSRQIQKLCLLGYFIFYLLFHSFVVFSGKSLHNNELAVYIVEDVLGKDITFTNRTEMWDAGLRVISESPLWGYGCVGKEWYLSNMSTFAVGPHNFVLVILIFGGIILLATFLVIVALSLVRFWPSVDKIGMVLILGIMTLFFMMCFEYYHFFFAVLLLTLAYYYPEISSQESKTASAT